MLHQNSKEIYVGPVLTLVSVSDRLLFVKPDKKGHFLLSFVSDRKIIEISPTTHLWRLRGGGEEVWLVLIHDLGSRRGRVVSITLRPRFTPGKGPPVPIGQEDGWALEPA
jgi:hypothetical protein